MNTKIIIFLVLALCSTCFNAAFAQCPPSYNLTTPITTTVALPNYEASQNITASNSISGAGTVVKYDAGRYVLLNPGFRAEQGTIFRALIEGCGGVYKSNISSNITNNIGTTTLHCSPNPFKGITNVIYTLTQDTQVTVWIYDITGKLVYTLANDQPQTEGTHTFRFDATNLPSGIYICTLQVGDNMKTQKLIVSK